VQFLGIFVGKGGEKYMVTEYLSLGSLNQLLISQQKKLQVIDLLGMCKHVAAGMRYISEQKKLVHRDLALRNLLVTLQENKYLIKIADLGLTRRVDAHTGLFTSKETSIPVKWTAPEAIQNGIYSNKSDVSN
jgi:serine/threonine protein kinase